MRIIVTGCAGFIGSHLCEELLQKGHFVYGIDSLFHGGKIENIASFWANPNFRFLPIHLCQLTEGYMRSDVYRFKADLIIHLAAVNSIQRSVEAPELIMQANITDSYGIYNIARLFRVKRVIFASSSSVYGDHPDPIKVEGKEGRVSSMYALSKSFLEGLAHVHWKSYGIEYVGLRFFNVFGPRQVSDGPYAPVIAKWVKSGVCEINGEGNQGRDYTHVSNVVHAITLSMETLHCNHIYNVGCGETTTLLQLANMLGFSRSDIAFKEARANEVKNSYASLTKAAALLDYEPITSLTEGLVMMGLYESFKHFQADIHGCN